MTVTTEREVVMDGETVRVTEVLSDGLGLFGKPIVRTSGRPLYLFPSEEYDNHFKGSKRIPYK